MSVFDAFKIFKNGVENWFSLIFNRVILNKTVQCRVKNVGSIEIQSGGKLLSSSLFRAVVFESNQNLTEEQLDILKTYLQQFKNEIITITNLEDGKKIQFL